MIIFIGFSFWFYLTTIKTEHIQPNMELPEPDIDNRNKLSV